MFKSKPEVDERGSNGNRKMPESSWQRKSEGKDPEA